MKQTMTNIDHFWYQLDHANNRMIITALFEFESTLNMERLLATLQHRWLCHHRFQDLVRRPFSGIGKPKWALDPNFDLRNHIHRVALPAGGDKESLKNMISDLVASPLDPTKPLWHIHVIENYGSGCAVFWRIHHCIADGIALIRVLLSMTDDSADASWPNPVPLLSNAFRPPLMSKMKKTMEHTKKNLSTGLEAVRNKTHLRRMVKQVTETAMILEKQIRMPADRQTTLKGPLSSRKDVAWSAPLPLAQIKRMGKSLQATVNEVLLTAISGALRRYLIQKNDSVAKLDLHVSMPVNIRKMGTEFELGNRFGIVSMSLPIFMKDPIKRLLEIKKRSHTIKNSVEPHLSYQVLKLLGAAPMGIARQIGNFFANKGTAVLSNVQGPTQPVYFAGNKIKNMMFWVPRSGGISTGISILSYAGSVSVGLSADSNIISDPQQIIDCFEAEIESLSNLSEAPSKTGKARQLVSKSKKEGISRAHGHKRPGGAGSRQPNIFNLGIRSIPFDELSRKYAQKDSKFIDLNGTKVHYCDQGRGPILLLLHGVLSSLNTWDDWATVLSSHFRVIRLDLPGFGLTTRLHTSPYNRDLFLDFLNQFVQAINVGTINIGGNSIGGYLAWNYAMQYPEKVNKLLLVDAVGYPQDLPKIMNFVNAPLIRNIAGRMTPWVFFDRCIHSLYGDKSKVTDGTIERYYDMAVSAENRGVYVDMMRLLKTQCDSEALCSGIDTIKSKTLLMWGEKDPWVPVGVVKNWERDLHSSETIIYDGVGHLPMEEIPFQSAEDAYRFLTAGE